MRAVISSLFYPSTAKNPNNNKPRPGRTTGADAITAS